MGWIFRAVFVVTVAMASGWEAPPASSVARPTDPAPVPTKEYACGAAGKPCPLQGWMKTTLAAAATRGDADAMANGFDYLAARSPAGYSDWARIAKEGAALARKKDIEGAKGACQSCHTKYKSKYREELRDRPL